MKHLPDPETHTFRLSIFALGLELLGRLRLLALALAPARALALASCFATLDRIRLDRVILPS